MLQIEPKPDSNRRVGGFDTLVEICSRFPDEFFWVDIFCKNQWVVNSDDTEAELASCVARARSSYDLGPPTLLLVLSPFPTPTLFTRVWWVDLAT